METRHTFRFWPLLLAFVLAAAFLVPTASIHGEQPGAVLRTGNYYFSLAPNGGNSPDYNATGIIPASTGKLLDGSATTYAGWMGNGSLPGTVQVVIDLLKDYPLDRINVVMNSPNSYWGFKEIVVKYRPEANTDYYYLAGKHVRTGTALNYAVNFPLHDAVARFIVIDMKRSHAYQHIPLSEVQIYRGVGDEGQSPGPALTLTELQDEMKKDGLMADRYGQWIYDDWPGKVTTDAQLQQEYATEAAALADVELDSDIYDPYGGIKALERQTASGYFRLQQIDGIWWFITPDGYPFIMKGVDAASIWEWGYGTPLKKSDGTPRRVFEELPDPTLYADAYSNDANGERVSLLTTNIMKKYGSDYEAKWEDITKKRLIDWGFNAFSKWSKPNTLTFPYLMVLQDPPTLKRIDWTYDVFDPQAESTIEASLQTQLQSAASDPWLIGYTYDNEAGWNADIVAKVLGFGADSPAKAKFVELFAERHNQDLAETNQILGTNAASFEDLKAVPITLSKVPSADVSAFIKLASRTYYSTVRAIIARYDTNHLFLGSSVVPTWRTSLDWDAASMAYVDAFSVDNYTNDPNWMARYQDYGKPLLNLEHTFSTTQHGLSAVNAATSVPTVADRGLSYKAFAEGQLNNPLFVGSGWFSYYDQAVTGRKDGENFNIGLVNQQDQPYADMIDIMKTTNAGLEAVHQGAEQPADPEVPLDIIVDNQDSGFVADAGWVSSSYSASRFGADYVHSNKLANKKATWTPYVTIPGEYNVYMLWNASADRASSARLEIGYDGGTDTTKTVNQKTNGNQWVWIGAYPFEAGTDQYVKITSASTTEYTIADAVKFSLASADPFGATHNPVPSNGTADPVVALDETDGSHVQTGSYLLTGQANEGVKLEVKLNGAAQTTPYGTRYVNVFQVPLNLTEGTNTIKLAATSRSGRTSELTLNLLASD
ncbi:hypothetical protein [Cohnella sp. GCM10012308]|uniref:golvesin C-terminal-like domain-containing protein n=1 Tax=Cohnella sp. GCM10012308 TaxID=3317329 RepID=UPI003615013C